MGRFPFFWRSQFFPKTIKKLKYLCEVKFQVNILEFVYTSKNLESSTDDNVKPRAAESQRGAQGRTPLRAPCQLQSTLGIVIQKGNTKSFKLNSFYFAAVNALNLIKLRKSSIIMKFLEQRHGEKTTTKLFGLFCLQTVQLYCCNQSFLQVDLPLPAFQDWLNVLDTLSISEHF